MLLLYAVNLVFGYSYNRAERALFYLPRTQLIVACAGCGLALAGRLTARATPAAAVLTRATPSAARIRPSRASIQPRPTVRLSDAGATEGLDDRRSILLVDSTAAREWPRVLREGHARKSRTPACRAVWYAPALVADNQTISAAT